MLGSLGACVLVALVVTPDFTTGCDLSNPGSLQECVKSILEGSRPALRAKYDPLGLPNYSGGNSRFSWSFYNIFIHGLSQLQIGRLSVSPASTQLVVRFSVSWPNLVGKADAKVKACRRILWKRRCVRARARPVITLYKPSAHLSTRLIMSFVGGSLHVRPSGTQITVKLPGVHVMPRVRGFVGFINRIIGNPAKKIANKLAGDWWRKSKVKIQNRLRDQLNSLIFKYLSRDLSRLLKGFKG